MVKISKYELTSLFKRVFNRESVQITPYDGYKVDKSLIRSNFDFDYVVPSYEVMIAEMKDWIEKPSFFIPVYYLDKYL
jgi:dTDP-4-dehydrorhamnose reductase